MPLEEGVVPGAGIEPAQPQWPRDFKGLKGVFIGVHRSLSKHG